VSAGKLFSLDWCGVSLETETNLQFWCFVWRKLKIYVKWTWLCWVFCWNEICCIWLWKVKAKLHALCRDFFWYVGTCGKRSELITSIGILSIFLNHQSQSPFLLLIVSLFLSFMFDVWDLQLRKNCDNSNGENPSPGSDGVNFYIFSFSRCSMFGPESYKSLSNIFCGIRCNVILAIIYGLPSLQSKFRVVWLVSELGEILRWTEVDSLQVAVW
jgi:hypothetical protein